MPREPVGDPRPKHHHPRPGLGTPPTPRPDPVPEAARPQGAVPNQPDVHGGWGVPIPGSVPIQPGGWTPMR